MAFDSAVLLLSWSFLADSRAFNSMRSLRLVHFPPPPIGVPDGKR
jgi:hypothetical protein